MYTKIYHVFFLKISSDKSIMISTVYTKEWELSYLILDIQEVDIQ